MLATEVFMSDRWVVGPITVTEKCAWYEEDGGPQVMSRMHHRLLLELLRANRLGSGGERGLKPSELAERLGLKVATVHNQTGSLRRELDRIGVPFALADLRGVSEGRYKFVSGVAIHSNLFTDEERWALLVGYTPERQVDPAQALSMALFAQKIGGAGGSCDLHLGGYDPRHFLGCGESVVVIDCASSGEAFSTVCEMIGAPVRFESENVDGGRPRHTRNIVVDHQVIYHPSPRHANNDMFHDLGVIICGVYPHHSTSPRVCAVAGSFEQGSLGATLALLKDLPGGGQPPALSAATEAMSRGMGWWGVVKSRGTNDAVMSEVQLIMQGEFPIATRDEMNKDRPGLTVVNVG